MTENAVTPQRSRNMRAVRSKDTRPEMKVRRTLHALGLRFRLHRGDLPGRPDIVLPRYRTVVFVHGCYWHRHEGCHRASVPKTRVDFWNRKFDANRERDRRSELALSNLGWKVIVVWECEISGQTDIRTLLTDRIVFKVVQQHSE